MSSLIWNNHTRNTASQASTDQSRLTTQEDSGNAISSQILAETKGNLPFINPETLERQKSLGRGTSFQVTCELFRKPGGPSYYVAVKHVVKDFSSFAEQERRLAVIKRELRVLMHPHLKTHSCVISIIGQGYRRDATQGILPYLVMDYSDHGTMTQYFHRCRIPVEERRELALDIGMALRALHDCDIIHGDVKMENVLVFDAPDNLSGRPQMARLADFGSAIFQDDFEIRHHVSYLGTSKYNAPEVTDREGPGVRKYNSCIATFKEADVYSFGLLVLEVAINGQSFIDRNWFDIAGMILVDKTKVQRKEEKAVLDWIFAKKEDYVLELAIQFDDRLPADTDSTLIMCFKNTLNSCLKDDGHKRGTMQHITKLLAEGTTEERPRITRARLYIGPPSTLPIVAEDVPATKPGTYYRMMPPTSENLKIRMIDPRLKGTGLESTVTLRSTQSALAPITLPSQYLSAKIDMFKVNSNYGSISSVASSRGHGAMADSSFESQEIPEKRDYYHLQASVLYLLGYGIRPNNTSMMDHLHAAARSNVTAKYILPRVAAANKGLVENEDKNLASTQFREDANQSEHGTHASLLDAFHSDAPDSIAQPESPGIKSDILISLTLACRQGNFELAQQLIPRCGVFPADYAPNPLHWLVRFAPARAKALLDVLLNGLPSSLEQIGICRNVLNTSCEQLVNIPEYCMDLLGTPLHWAVRCGSYDLVRNLIEKGAEIDKRWKSEHALYAEPSSVRYPSFSPLDVAVTYHFAEIVALLLDKAASKWGGDIQWEYSPFHMIGQKTTPFARFVCHGSRCREAVRLTISTLQRAGLDINSFASLYQTPLISAMKSIDLEQYVVEELLRAGAQCEGASKPQEENFATLVASTCADRRFNSWKLALLVEYILDINELDSTKRNALHYCAIFEGADMAKVLVDHLTCDIERRAADPGQNTALLYCAKFGSPEVASLLIAKGADIHLPDFQGMSPLDAAVSSRHLRMVEVLINANARLRFTNHSGPGRNILHAAVVNSSNRPSVVRAVLKMITNQDTRSLIDEFDAAGWTPLHVATYFADEDGVDALLEAGADRNIFKNPQLPLRHNLGGTPYQMVSRVIDGVKERGPGRDHQAIVRLGSSGVTEFLQRLEAIRIRLQ